MNPVIWLFDIDGVLVQPGGYRAAVRETVNHFTRQMGLGDFAPSDEVYAIFESQGITCEWDMVPITLAFILEAASARIGHGFDTLESAFDALRQHDLSMLAVDYAPTLRALGSIVQPGVAPADSLLALVEEGQGLSFFPRLAGKGVLRELFTHTRRPAVSRTTHVFETFVLGHEVYYQALGLPVEVHSEPLLETLDRPLLLPETREQVREWIAQGRLHAAAYTARPSSAVEVFSEPLAVCLPEAEAALRLVGFEDLPLIGSGHMGELSVRLGEPEDRLTKPAPYHALAASASAWTGDRGAALVWVAKVFRAFERGEAMPAESPLPDRLHLHVFEDSPTGMMGGKSAVKLLNTMGIEAQVHLWGVTTHPEKAQALENQGAAVFPDINTAIREASGI